MKKNKKTKLMAAVLTGAAMLTGCEPSSDNVQDVYGPPVMTDATTKEPSSKYDPSKNDIEEVYGPPVTEAEEEATAPATEFKPENETVAALYGPPPTEESEESTVYEPSRDKVQTVYGPPES